MLPSNPGPSAGWHGWRELLRHRPRTRQVPQRELQFSILLDESFDTETYVDIFDGGPTVDARVVMLKTVARSRRVRLANGAADSAVDHKAWQLVSHTLRDGFTAVLRRANGGRLDAAINTTTRAHLGLHAGSTLLVAELDGAAA